VCRSTTQLAAGSLRARTSCDQPPCRKAAAEAAPSRRRRRAAPLTPKCGTAAMIDELLAMVVPPPPPLQGGTASGRSARGGAAASKLHPETVLRRAAPRGDHQRPGDAVSSNGWHGQGASQQRGSNTASWARDEPRLHARPRGSAGCRRAAEHRAAGQRTTSARDFSSCEQFESGCHHPTLTPELAGRISGAPTSLAGGYAARSVTLEWRHVDTWSNRTVRL
jgi:hypothetical protein